MNPGFEFLKNRGFSSDTIKTFAITYYDGNRLYGPEETLDLNLTQKVNRILQNLKSNEATKDKFTHSVIFPITDLYTRPVAIFARMLEGRPKFNAIPFAKQTILYGLDASCNYVLDKNHIYITEGIFDFLMLWQHGVRNAACALGTNISHHQMCLSFRFTPNINLIFDPDNAGRIGAVKARKRITRNGGTCNNIVLDEHLDLDDYIIKHGIQRFLRYAKNFRQVQTTATP